MSSGPFDDKTGDPTHDNEARRLNKRITAHTRTMLRVNTPSGWRRKRVINRLERQRYSLVIGVVLNRQVDANNAARGLTDTTISTTPGRLPLSRIIR